MYKMCCRCKRRLDAAHCFYKNRSNKDGYAYACKDCVKEENKRYCKPTDRYHQQKFCQQCKEYQFVAKRVVHCPHCDTRFSLSREIARRRLNILGPQDKAWELHSNDKH